MDNNSTLIIIIFIAFGIIGLFNLVMFFGINKIKVSTSKKIGVVNKVYKSIKNDQQTRADKYKELSDQVEKYKPDDDS